MHNIGTWNSNLALFYLIVFLTPLWLKMIFWTIQTFKLNTVVKVIDRPVYKTVSVPVYKDRVIYKEKSVKQTVKQPVKNKAKKPTATLSSTPVKVAKVVDSKIIDDVVSGLKTLGITKKDAKELVLKVHSCKLYSSAEELMNDSIAELHKMRT